MSVHTIDRPVVTACEQASCSAAASRVPDALSYVADRFVWECDAGHRTSEPVAADAPDDVDGTPAARAWIARVGPEALGRPVDQVVALLHGAGLRAEIHPVAPLLPTSTHDPRLVRLKTRADGTVEAAESA